MEKMIVSVILISTIVGAIAGFGASYLLINQQLQNINIDLSNIKYQIDVLNSVVDELYGSKARWHFVYRVEGDSDNITGTFPIKGKSTLIRWIMTGHSGDSQISIGIHYSNGNLYTHRGSSGVYGSFASEIGILEAGNYYLNITTNDVEHYIVVVWDYY